jgi:polyphosphate kinase 2 (PPK2 family)
VAGVSEYGDLFFYDSKDIAANGDLRTVMSTACISAGRQRGPLDKRCVVKVKSRDDFDCAARKYNNVEAVLYNRHDEAVGSPFLSYDDKLVMPETKGLKVCIIFEGRDGAGKGGVIKAITERVSPRTFHVVALPAPTEREKTQMYAQRYMSHLPSAGEVVIFDRSWYNRAGVERVMGFCTEEEAKCFLQVTPLFEKLAVEYGIILLKYWLEVSPEEQTRRLEGRIDDGRKIWKLSPMDLHF